VKERWFHQPANAIYKKYLQINEKSTGQRKKKKTGKGRDEIH
jgi:hypothetical protein